MKPLPALLVVAPIAVLAGACTDPLSVDECNVLLGRYTELLAREEDPDLTPEQVASKVRAAQRAAREIDLFELDRCPDEVSRRQFDCAMDAPNVDGMERCLVL